MNTLGQELRAEREKRGLTVKDVSDRTKIGSRFLTALEEGRWEEMPQKFFLRSVIKAHAQAVGADPAPFLARFEEQERLRSAASDEDGEAPKRKKRERPPVRRKRRILVPVVATLFIVAAAAAVAWLFLKPGSATAPRIPSASPPLPLLSSPAVVEPEAKEAEPVETGLRLELRFAADAWMHVTADGVVVLDGIKPPGTTASLRAEREFVLQTGNAGGFDFTLNGRPGRPLGGSGVVLTDIRITTENYETFLRDGNAPAAGPGGR